MLSWPIISIILPLLFWLLGNWKYVLIISVALPHLLIAYIIFTKFNDFLEEN